MVAFTETQEFLTAWANIAGEGFWKAAVKVGGTGGVIALLAFGAFVLNILGDAAIPQLSRWVGHFRSENVRWSIEHAKHWDELKSDYRTMMDVGGMKRGEWFKIKDELGKWQVRIFRITFWLCLILLSAGVIDLFSPHDFGNRGVAYSLSGFLGLLASMWLWANREGQYVENFLHHYRHEYEKKHENGPQMPSVPKGFR